MTKKVEKSNVEEAIEEAAPSGDVTENEEQPTAEVKPKTEKKPAPVIEQIEINDTVPAWLKPLSDQLGRIEAGLKPQPQAQPPAGQPAQSPAEQSKGEAQNATKKKGKIKLWRTF